MENTTNTTATVKMTNAKALDFVLTTYKDTLPSDVAEKIEKIKASIEKKATNSTSHSKITENKPFADKIVEVLTNKARPMTIAEVIADGNLGFTPQKFVGVAKPYIDNGTIVKYRDGKKVMVCLPQFAPSDKDEADAE